VTHERTRRITQTGYLLLSCQAREDVLNGGDGNDMLDGTFNGGQQDKLYCGKGKDRYSVDTNDYVDSSCENLAKPSPKEEQGGGA